MGEMGLAHRLCSCGAAAVYEALGRRGAMDAAIRPLWTPVGLAGPAFTVRGASADNLALHRAVATAPEGVVIVAATERSVAVPIWGSLLSSICSGRGILGLVTDGAVRDSDQIRGLRFPVFCAGVGLLGPSKKVRGALGEVIEVGGVRVAPGDWVIGDGDGVVLVPAERIQEVAEKAATVGSLESEMIRRAIAGESTLAQLDVEEPT